MAIFSTNLVGILPGVVQCIGKCTTKSAVDSCYIPAARRELMIRRSLSRRLCLSLILIPCIPAQAADRPSSSSKQEQKSVFWQMYVVMRYDWCTSPASQSELRICLPLAVSMVARWDPSVAPILQGSLVFGSSLPVSSSEVNTSLVQKFRSFAAICFSNLRHLW